jgi:hypothetical protein
MIGTTSVHVRLGEDQYQHDLHVRQHPCTVLVILGEERDTRQTDALRDGLEGRLLFGLVIGPGDALLRLWRGPCVDRDGGWCHCG